MLVQEAGSVRSQDSTLVEILELVGMELGGSSVGWRPEAARLYAIDVAMGILRRNADVVPEATRLALIARLHEARIWVECQGEVELTSIQADVETLLAPMRNVESRRMCLAAVDALLPSPYRSALVSTRNALLLGATGALGDVATLLRTRLAARLVEASWIVSPTAGMTLAS